MQVVKNPGVRAWLHEWVFGSRIFRDAYSALYVVTALFCGATALSVFQAFGVGRLVVGMLICHALLVIGTQYALRFHILKALPTASVSYTPDEYRFFCWVVLRNALIHVGVYLFFVFLTFRGEADVDAAVYFGLLGLMSGIFCITGMGRGRI